MSSQSNLPTKITAFYRFIDIPVTELSKVKATLEESASSLGINGLVLVAKEGLNGTIAGSSQAIESYKVFLLANYLPSDQEFKDSYAQKTPFKRFKVDLREEIVSLFDESIDVARQLDHSSYLSPKEWKEAIESEKEDIVLLDTRNKYETKLGVFKGAIDPQIDVFSEFPEYVAKSEIPKDKKILMYCTGGIRCEKASLAMKKAGYEKVYQLHGGILKYLEEFPNSLFDGECFVFDHRVAVDQELRPSQRFSLCPHCGNPADQKIECQNCSTSAVICDDCRSMQKELTACSKNCLYHLNKPTRKSA